MNKKFVLVFFLGLLWFDSGKAEEKMEKIEPPDWYKAGVVAAIEDKNSELPVQSSLLKDITDWLPSYLLPEQRKIVIEKVVNRLADNDVATRIRAIKLLARLKAKEAIPNIIPLTKDNDGDIRFQAVRTLRELEAKEAILQLFERAASEHDEELREAIISMGDFQVKKAIPQLLKLFLDKNEKSKLREDAIKALGVLKIKGEIVEHDALEIKKVISQLITTISTPDISWFDEEFTIAINALGILQAKEAIPQLLRLLPDQKSYDRDLQTIIQPLVALQAKETIPYLQSALTKNIGLLNKEIAIAALADLYASEATQQLLAILTNSDEYTDKREIAMKALAKLQAKEAIPQLLKVLVNKDESSSTRQIAITALVDLQAKEAIPQLLTILANEDEYYEIGAESVKGLAKLLGREAIPNLISILAKNSRDDITEAAMQALGLLQAKEAVPQVVKIFLNANNIKLREKALETLRVLQAKEIIHQLIPCLELECTYIDSLLKTLSVLQANEQELLQTTVFFALHNKLASLYGSDAVLVDAAGLSLENRSLTRENRVTAHLIAGTRFQILVWCLGNNDRQDCNKQTFQTDRQKAIYALNLFKDFYQMPTKDAYGNIIIEEFNPKLRDDLVVKINMVAEALVEQQGEVSFTKLYQELIASQDLRSKFKVLDDIFAAQEEVTLLDDISKLMAKDGYDTKDLERKKADILAKQQLLQSVIATSSMISLHLGFWLILIFLYPRSPMIQAIFFWNPWIRRIIGLGYIGFCLTWIPFLRRRLLYPFKDSLLADANLATFQAHLYFANMSITLKGLDQPQPLLETLAKSRGQIILEGESGLGKTMYLRHLAQHSTRPFAFLHATRCTAGVIPALKEKLHGFAQNQTFLTSIIYAGGVDLCIDGLNEVSPDTRAKITQFVEQHFKGTILLSTQPLEWQPPQTAKTYRLLPLNRQQMEAFLLSRPEQPENYAQTCTDYLNAALSSQLDRALSELHLKILSNLMDLTVVAHLLAQGIQPNLNNLIQQQYQTMNEDYQGKSFSQQFPLNKFAQHVFEIRSQDKRVLNHADFGKELDCLEEHKLVIKRTEKEGDAEQENYYFRHDKIWDFFNAHIFKQHDNEWRKSYFADERFRGAFLALAWSLPLNDAQALLAELQHYIVQTNDNILHHQYYQLLDLRIRLPQ